jgi:hypothetical protein
MSAIGTKQTWQFVRRMSAFGGKADMAIALRRSTLMNFPVLRGVTHGAVKAANDQLVA